jgi:hypothetical protein
MDATKVMGWFGNIKNQKIELGKSSDGTLITSMPEDMFNVIHMQVTTPREMAAFSTVSFNGYAGDGRERKSSKRALERGGERLSSDTATSAETELR